MEVLLNIGLHTAAGKTIEATTAVQAAADAGFFIYGTEVFQSDTEPTLVVTAAHSGGPKLRATIAALSVALHQDCIAYYGTPHHGQASGHLAGPKADAWGAFNPEFFILPDGTRLSEKIVAKAA